jgi:hypothetical protein
MAASPGAQHDRPKTLGQRPRTHREILDQSIFGDLIETGVWHGETTIFMRATLKAYEVHDRRVFVAASFRGIPPIDPQKYPADSAHEGMDQLEILNDNSAERVRENFRRINSWTTKWFFWKGGARIHSLR